MYNFRSSLYTLPHSLRISHSHSTFLFLCRRFLFALHCERIWCLVYFTSSRYYYQWLCFVLALQRLVRVILCGRCILCMQWIQTLGREIKQVNVLLNLNLNMHIHHTKPFVGRLFQSMLYYYYYCYMHSTLSVVHCTEPHTYTASAMDLWHKSVRKASLL